LEHILQPRPAGAGPIPPLGNLDNILESPLDFPGVLHANAGDWLFLAATYDGILDTVSLYLDGELLDSDTLALTVGSPENYLPTSATSFSVGGRHNDGGGAVNGMIDELALWSRVLSGDEIAALYNDGAGLRVPEPTSAGMLLIVLLAVAGIRPRRRGR